LHCQIIVDGDIIKIEDLGSTNGTFINDQPTREARVLPGQRIRLGEIGMRLESESSAREPARLEQQAAAVSLSGGANDEPGQVVWARWPSVAPSTDEEEKAVY